MNIDVNTIITLIPLLSALYMFSRFLVRAGMFLAGLKKDIEFIKTNQVNIIADIKKLEEHVFS